MENELLNTIKLKFESKGYHTEVNERTSQTLNSSRQIDSQQHTSLKISIPEERGKKIVFIGENDDLKGIIDENLEEFKFLKGFEAIWSEKLQTIECELDYNDESNLFWLEDYTMHFHAGLIKDFDSITFGSKKNKTLEFPSSIDGLKILVGDSSKQFSFLDRLQRKTNYKYYKTTIRIEGVRAYTHDAALNILVKISNAVLFQFDLATGMAVRLLLNKEHDTGAVRYTDFNQEELKFQKVRFEYDNEAISLYMYARASTEMPLLQYLAFYQVLEFYFPLYSYRDAQQKIKNFIKNPLFDVNKDTDISSIIDLIKVSGKGKSIGDERTQIKSTMHQIIDSLLLSKYFDEDSDRKDFFDQQKKNKGLAKQKINFTSSNIDIRDEVALRIYEIRNRVVHSKDDDNSELLLPYSRELSQLSHDLQLIEFLAQKAIIAASRPLNIY